MTPQVEDFEAIRRRVEELKAERDLALTGSAVVQEVGEVSVGYPYMMTADYDNA